MNTKNKIMTCLMLSAGGAVSLALLNKYIQFSATSRGLTRKRILSATNGGWEISTIQNAVPANRFC